ncbi:hypothetical protein WI36_17290, partial [Burkholderia ubonensis]
MRLATSKQINIGADLANHICVSALILELAFALLAIAARKRSIKITDPGAIPSELVSGYQRCESFHGLHRHGERVTKRESYDLIEQAPPQTWLVGVQTTKRPVQKPCSARLKMFQQTSEQPSFRN